MRLWIRASSGSKGVGERWWVALAVGERCVAWVSVGSWFEYSGCDYWLDVMVYSVMVEALM